DLVLEQRGERAGLEVQRADGRRRLAIVLLGVHRAVARDMGDRQVLAVGRGGVEQLPAAAFQAVQLAALVVLAAFVRAGGADGEPRLLAGVQGDGAVLLGR